MLPTSEKYKQFVYNNYPYALDARHFIPYALIKIIDVSARSVCSYSASSEAFYSNLPQLMDDIHAAEFAWGTLEDFQFLLSSNVRLMPDSDTEVRAGQTGWVSEVMSNELGVFEEDVILHCPYTKQVSTVGRVLYFDSTFDAYPVDMDIVYYRTGTEIGRDTIRNNNSYVVTSMYGVQRYDKMELHILSTSHPYRRVHLLEDIPGVYLEYSGADIVSLSVSQVVDIFSEEITVGEIELAIQNVTKSIDILNKTGLEKYLQRRQPIEVKLIMVFPDDSTEEVLLGYWSLSAWKSNKGALEATFTIRDPIEKLTQDKYIKGALPTVNASMYDLAKNVLEDAGVEDYEIDVELMNIYTKAALPIAEHKELLRMLAQACQSVIVPTPEGGIHVKYISPLVYAANTLDDGDFSLTGKWTMTNCALSTDYIYAGSNSVKMTVSSTATLEQTVTVTPGRKFYCRFYALPTEDLTGDTGEAALYLNDTKRSVNLEDANLTPEEWTMVSFMYTPTTEAQTVSMRSTLTKQLYVDGFMMLDLTLIYGAGKEPDQEWCDTNIRFFPDIMMVPRCVDPAPLDTLDYHILLDAPEVELSDPVKSVETNIYSYETASETSEVYKGSRIISGTETFDIEYSSLARDCTVTAKAVDDSGAELADVTVTVVESTLYSRAATLKIRANCTVQIIVTGKKVTLTTSTYKVTSDLDPTLVADAVARTIDNELITYKTCAEDVTSFAAYWYGRRYNYDFDWRQNPAIEVLDTITVHDDFDNNNGVYLVGRELEYNNGILTGSSKGVY